MLRGHERIQLAHYICRAERTVLRVYQGKGSPQSREACRRGALALGLPLPPEPSAVVKGDSDVSPITTFALFSRPARPR